MTKAIDPALAHHPRHEGSATFWRAVLRGIGVVLPSLLTIIFLLWLWNAISTYVLRPIEAGTRHLVVRRVSEVYRQIPKTIPESQIERNPLGEPQAFVIDGRKFVRLLSQEWVPQRVVSQVSNDPGMHFPTTAEALYDRYVQRRWFRPEIVIPIMFVVFLLFTYIVGRAIAARLGAMLFHYFERLVHRLPLVSTVYATVKQVTDIVFAETKLPYNRIVAVQYPREGIWSLGFATGDSLAAINQLVGEPTLSVLIPTSPMPATGFTITVRKRDAIELNLTLDQAFQFVVSCGVVAADRQRVVTPDGSPVVPWPPGNRLPNDSSALIASSSTGTPRNP